MKYYLTDTHTHIYAEEFDKDRSEIVENAFRQGIKKILLLNIDGSTIEPMLNLSKQYPENIYPMMGLHPTSVKENFKDELKIILQLNFSFNFVANRKKNISSPIPCSLIKNNTFPFKFSPFQKGVFKS